MTPFNTLLNLVKENAAVIKWLSLGSLITFCATPLLVLLIVIKLPPDYFAGKEDKRPRVYSHLRPVHLIVVGLKNLLGLVFVCTGLVLLLTPGQGVLTVLIGVMLLDFPGKYRLEKRLIARQGVMESINRLRRRFRKPPLNL